MKVATPTIPTPTAATSSGALVNWFTFNNGLHGNHHLHPSLHWSLLREAHFKNLSPRIDKRLELKSLEEHCFRAYLAPGGLRRFDGSKVVLGPTRKDEPSVPTMLQPRRPVQPPELHHGALFRW